MKDSILKKYGQVERSYRIGIGLLAIGILLALLISWAIRLFPLLTGEEALRGGFLFPVDFGVSQVQLDELPDE